MPNIGRIGIERFDQVELHGALGSGQMQPTVQLAPFLQRADQCNRIPIGANDPW